MIDCQEAISDDEKGIRFPHENIEELQKKTKEKENNEKTNLDSPGLGKDGNKKNIPKPSHSNILKLERFVF